jgi:uncharacterized protein YqhQ
MKSPEKTAMAVRKPDKTIEIIYLEDKNTKFKIAKLPIIRGVVNFVKSMVQGYKALMISADKSGFTDLEEEKTEKNEKKQGIFVAVILAIGSVLGVALSIGLFMLLPRLFVGFLESAFKTDFSKFVRSGIEQFLKLAIFVGYVWAVSFMKDIKRVFMYHGAEHKTIFCYEAGLPLTVENARKQTRFHPRCGTSFMILMILISIIISTIVQMIFPQVYDMALVWVLIKILLIPLTCGVGYEVLKACGKYDNIITKIISAPGLWLQRLTTKEPEDDMLEIAIAAIKACEPEVPDVERNCTEEE